MVGLLSLSLAAIGQPRQTGATHSVLLWGWRDEDELGARTGHEEEEGEDEEDEAPEPWVQSSLVPIHIKILH